MNQVIVHVNKPPSFTNSGKFFDQLKDYQPLKKNSEP